MNRYYLLGKQIKLGARIGVGGEGEVFQVLDLSNKAIKLYSNLSDTHRSEKIKKIVELGLAKRSNFISFPDEVVTSSKGDVVGFSMNLVKDHQQIHNLYGVKSRKQLFPDADYRFLVRVASNVARAIAEVHSLPCVIGDINHSGILVSKTATVTLIDADSFQLKDNQTIYPCIVGVPDFTPPELQGRSFRNIERTQIHDQFGLAVLIFQILVMGRHPFAGKGRDISLEECISQYLFAYTRKKSISISPPPGVPHLEVFPEPIASAFENSFADSSANKRTTALEWVHLLEEFEKSLIKCSLNARHFYSKGEKGCPWCKMESITGAFLFNGGVTLITSTMTIGDVERVLSEVLSVNFDENNLYPKFPDFTPTPEMNVSRFNSIKTKFFKAMPAVLWCLMGISIISFFASPHFIFLVLSGFFGWLGNKAGKTNYSPLVQKYKSVDKDWALTLRNWREDVLTEIYNIRHNLEKTVLELKELNNEKEGKLRKIKDGHREKQFFDYLDTFLIKNADIPGISTGLIASLASHGIESAADIEYYKIMAISGFGEGRTGKLVAWRRNKEQRFKYNPQLQTHDITAQNHIINQYELKMRDKKSYIEQQKKFFDQSRDEFNKISQSEVKEISKIYLEREQLKFDLISLKIPVPASEFVATRYSGSSANTKPSGSWGKASPSSQSQVQASSTPSCPHCGSGMVRRWGGKGARKGNLWGCSRYPKCHGTRNL